MRKFPTTLFVTVLLALAGVGGGYALWRNASTPGSYDGFATCLGERGLTFYGAYWCPHCATQKKLFGKSAKLLPYVECAIPGSQSMTQACQEQGIKSFPTWIGPGDDRAEGVIELEDLASRSGCALPS